jgi:hypothetical protein
MNLAPQFLRNKALTVSIGATLLADGLCWALRSWNFDASKRSLPELIEFASLNNLPLGICLAAWGVVLMDVEEGYSPSKIQLATVILFFGTVFPVVTSVSSAPLAVAVGRRLLSLF